MRPHSAQEVADGLLKLAREELSKQLPAFLSRSLKTVQAIALQVMEARKDGREYGHPTVNNIRYIDEEQVKLLEPVAGAQAGKRAEVDDVFDLGQSLYALVAGSPPPPGITHAEFAEKSGLDLPPAFLRTFANLCAERSELRLKSVSEVCDRLQELKHHAPAIQ